MHADSLAAAPSAPPDLVHQGNARRKVGDLKGAEDAYRQATNIDPKCGDGWRELGCLMLDCRRFWEAIFCFRRILSQEILPDLDPSAQNAARLLAAIVAADPEWERGQFTLGCAYEHLGDLEQARLHLGNALQLDPTRQAAVQSLFARMHWQEKNWAEAMAAADRSLEANPNFFLAHVIRSKCASELADMPQAVASMRRAIEISPHSEFHSGLLFEMNYLLETTPESLYAEACRWSSAYAAPLGKLIRPHTNRPDPDRVLKIGYASPDLYGHPIAKFLIPVLEFHDRSRFEIFVYSVGSKRDNITDYIRKNTENFVAAQGPYLDFARQVRKDEIDVLVDLAGHTSGPSYLAFALKPAPVQVSWLGVLSTTGLPTIDYFLGDAQMPCPGSEHLFSETVYRLPRSFCCYRPTADLALAPSPYFERGHITFGCFNNPGKITRDVVRMWSAILHLVPNSRLLLKWHGMDSEIKHNRLAGWFVSDGIARERIQFAGGSTTTKYLEDYAAIDIALDPFPYNGGSTTLDTLWMGVPLVTLSGRMAVQRMGASVLSAVGLPDLITATPEQYLKVALYLAAVIPALPDLRRQVRQALRSSPLMDEIGIVRDVENAYREMWRNWCRRRD